MDQNITFLISFLAGVFSFLSPCVLPIVPGFISYIAGKSFSDIQNSSQLRQLKLLPIILLFISGFSIVFIVMGASIDYLSDLLYNYKKILNYASGVLITFLGLYFMGIINIKNLCHFGNYKWLAYSLIVSYWKSNIFISLISKIFRDKIFSWNLFYGR